VNLTLWWVKPLIYALVVAGALGAFAAFVKHERDIGAAKATAELQRGYDEGMAEAKKLADAEFAKKIAATEKSHVEDIARTEAQHAAELDARSELDRLRTRLQSPRAPAPRTQPQAGPVIDARPDDRQLLGACAERYESVAGDAGRLANQVIGLQGYVRASCLQPDQIESGVPLAAEGSRAGIIDLVSQTATGPRIANSGGVAPP
jgi:hypothetical protein